MSRLASTQSHQFRHPANATEIMIGAGFTGLGYSGMAVADMKPAGRGNCQIKIYRSKELLVKISRIPAQPKPGILNVLIEIPAGSKNKYEFDKELQAFALDRVLYSSVQYPYDYGFVPNTLADDGDPLDGMVLMDQPTFPGCVIAARPIGMLEMIDGGDRDEKILCVPAADPRYANVKSLKDVAISPPR